MQKYRFHKNERQEIDNKKYPFDDMKITVFSTNVDSELYTFIPDGQKFFFVLYKQQYIAFLNERTKQIVFGYKLPRKLLVNYPLVGYGTKFFYKRQPMFCIENVLDTFTKPIQDLEKRISHLKTTIELFYPFGSTDKIMFSVPLMQIEKTINEIIPYRVKSFQMYTAKGEAYHVSFNFFKRSITR